MMANTYTQLYIHTVFAVKGRQNLIPRARQRELYRFIAGIVERRDHKVLAIGGVADHVHLFLGLNPATAISDLMRDVKAGSSRFINDKGWVGGRFRWQEGYGAFSHSRSQIQGVCSYIENQEKHHMRQSFKDEYVRLLRRFGVRYDERFLFDWIEGTEIAQGHI